uniref:Uncharacterized protein n=1 Tax=Setaria italica TaxID=4555 RepID=K3ZKU2_SETIT
MINKNRNQRYHKPKLIYLRHNRAQYGHQPALAPRMCTIYKLESRRRPSLHVFALATLIIREAQLRGTH